MRTFYRKILSSKIENVGFEPRLCVPGAVCCHYTTFSMTILTGCCVPFGTRSATTEPVGENEPGLRSATVGAERRCPGPSAPFGATVRRTNLYTIGLYYGFYCRRTDGCRPAFLQYSILFLFDLLPADSADQSGHPHLLAGVSTTMISSMVTPKTAARMTRLSMEGMAVPWIHL